MIEIQLPVAASAVDIAPRQTRCEEYRGEDCSHVGQEIGVAAGTEHALRTARTAEARACIRPFALLHQDKADNAKR